MAIAAVAAKPARTIRIAATRARGVGRQGPASGSGVHATWWRRANVASTRPVVMPRNAGRVGSWDEREIEVAGDQCRRREGAGVVDGDGLWETQRRVALAE